MDPVFFASPAEFRAWLESHHEHETELLVGFWKKGTRRPTLTWSESVDQALCFGWIDGVRRRIDDEAYSIRFTPRKPTSNWSQVNIDKVAALTAAGLMRAAGERAFAARREERSGVYSFERKAAAKLEPEQQRRFEADVAAWDFFREQAAWYRRAALHWVVSAKRPETRERRLAQLIESSASAVHVPPLRRRG